MRMALWWGGGIVACAAVIAGLKLALTAAAPNHHFLSSLTSPSGHGGMSAIVYGGFVLLLGPSLTRGWRVLAQIGVAILVLAVAVSRIVLHEHTIAETVVGLGVGIAALAMLRAGLVRPRRSACRPRRCAWPRWRSSKLDAGRGGARASDPGAGAFGAASTSWTRGTAAGPR